MTGPARPDLDRIKRDPAWDDIRALVAWIEHLEATHACEFLHCPRRPTPAPR